MKKFKLNDKPFNDDQKSIIAFFLRLFIGIIMLLNIFHDIIEYNNNSFDYINQINFGSSIFTSNIIKLCFSVFILLGLFTRISAIILLLNVIVDLFIIGGRDLLYAEFSLFFIIFYILIFLFGGGYISLDYCFFKSDIDAQLYRKRNLGIWGRCVRMLIAFIFWILIFTGYIGIPLKVILILFSFPLIVSAFTGYSPIRAFVKNSFSDS